MKKGLRNGEERSNMNFFTEPIISFDDEPSLWLILKLLIKLFFFVIVPFGLVLSTTIVLIEQAIKWLLR